ncbi:MAG: hypothetical protein EA428_08960 [Spirochaetaceae bacterium]|nr:MAG: hypothetical protein EA428_08960 [Spirochaetaceae bacterium]
MKNGRLRVAPAALMPYHPAKVLKRFREFGPAAFGVVLLTLLTVILFTGCIDIESNLTFSDPDTGTIEFRYRMYTELYRATALDRDPSEPMFPVLESDFARLARMHPDLELLRYRQTEDEGHVTVTVSLAFLSIDGLNFAFGGGNIVTVEELDDHVVVSQQFGTQNDAGATNMTAPYGSAEEVFGDLIEGYRFVTRINSPANLQEVDPESARRNARRAELEIPLSRLLDLKDTVRLEVSW